MQPATCTQCTHQKERASLTFTENCWTCSQPPALIARIRKRGPPLKKLTFTGNCRTCSLPPALIARIRKRGPPLINSLSQETVGLPPLTSESHCSCSTPPLPKRVTTTVYLLLGCPYHSLAITDSKTLCSLLIWKDAVCTNNFSLCLQDCTSIVHTIKSKSSPTPLSVDTCSKQQPMSRFF